MLLRSEGFVRSGVAVVGATPAFNSAGVETASTTLAATHALAYPTGTIPANDLLILIGWGQNTNLNAGLALHADAVTAGFANIAGSPFLGAGPNRVMVVAWKLASGSEGGTTLTNACTGSGGISADGFLGRIERWTAANGFKANPFESISMADNGTNDTTVPGIAITPAGINRRGVAYLSMTNDPTTPGPFSGASWAVAFTDIVTTSGGMGLQTQTVDLSAGSPISAGSLTTSDNVTGVTVGFALVPSGG